MSSENLKRLSRAKVSNSNLEITPFGDQLVTSISLSEVRLNQLFAALLLTALGAFIVGNLFLLDPPTLWISAQISLHCIGVVLIFYMLSRQLDSLIWGLVLTYGLMLALVYSHINWLLPVVYVVEVAALLYTIKFFRVQRRNGWPLLLMSMIGVATSLGVWRAYTSFDMIWRLHSGVVHQDTLFHASIAAMIKNYGIASTGLHGLIEIPYHTLSHALFASVSLMSGLGVIEVYGVANWVLFAPLLIFAVSALCCMLDHTEHLLLHLVWGLVAGLLVVMPFLFGRWALADSYFVSESYLVSLGLFVLGMALLFKHRLKLPDLILVILLAGLISNAKASVGLIFAGLWFVRLLFVRSDQKVVDLVAFLLATSMAGWVVFASASVSAESGAISFSPFNFLGYSFLGSHIIALGKAILQGTDISGKSLLLAILGFISFFTIHFILTWLVAVQIIRINGLLAIFKVPAAIFVVASAVAGSLIIFVFDMPGGSAYYFSNVSFFVALPVVVVLLVHWLERWITNQKIEMLLSIVLLIASAVAGNLIIFVFDIPGGSAYYFSNVSFFVALPVVIVLLVHWLKRWITNQKIEMVLSIVLLIIVVLSLPVYFKNSIFDPKHYVTDSKNILIDKLLKVREAPEKNIVLRYGLNTSTVNPIVRCTAKPFVFPAVSERPWVGVINLDEDCKLRYYGYGHYKISGKNQVGVVPGMTSGMVVHDFK